MRLSDNPFSRVGVLALTSIFIRSTTLFSQDSLSYEIIHLSNRYCPPLENPDNVCSTIEINTVKFQNAQIGQAIQSKIDKEIISSAAAVLGKSLAAMVDFLDPAKIVIGGGLWLGSDLYRNLVLASYEKNVTKRRKAPEVINSVAGSNAAVIGAAIAAN